ncbi:MAG: hypothetical protein A2W93_05425 [Bacteroidetes bacterium GWF2_43_63]|nr:MAG: hypothetical protein A2W94_11725 [Bacteroidetes bacterium GWE2_42_42]OFY56315.1 MAG: hypothetical protein A2W93_05425 [Bacteroidetes bacterium GWF2_43_63]HBG71995.1 hypothetical protein [Bacteroidales bacterium]HCB61896.1 hypothetical protein [Bacteroidales bacterium]HCY23918.1 hypothetical protein [Bacteroidales bacterium]
MKNISFLIVLLFFSVFCTTTKAQSGGNDHTFNTLDHNFNGANSAVSTMAVQSDGKIIIGGSFTAYNGMTRKGIARLNTDGSLDASFNPGTGTGTVLTTAIQSDGKIIIGGSFTIYNGTTINRIARLNADGSLDATFDPAGGANNTVNTIAVQNDGKIIIGGNFTTYNGTTRNYIARINTDGSLDTSFDPGSGTNFYIYSIAVQSNGKIIIGGNFLNYNGTTRSKIARINADGSLDTTFNPGNGANGTILTTAIQSDGKIIIGGHFSTYDGWARDKIARINADGSLDGTFLPSTGANTVVRTTAIQSDGKIIIGGDFTTYNGTVRNGIARINADGSLDVTFYPGSGVENSTNTACVNSTAIQSNGKVIIVGDFTTYDGVTRNYIAQTNSNGWLDFSFNFGKGANGLIRTTTVQSDGKIIIGGDFTVYNGTPRNYIARINTDGSLDATFNPGSGPNSGVFTTVVQSDGKIIIGGGFLSYNGTERKYITRINSDGTLDASFWPLIGPNSYVLTTAVQSDGKIIIGGNFSTYYGIDRMRIARLNTDGSLDASFNPGSGVFGTDLITSAVQSDGKIIIGGTFGLYDGTTRHNIARVNSDGSCDYTFNASGTNNFVYSVAVQSDGKIILGGGFTNYNGTTINKIARVNTNGSLDTTFDPASATNGTVYTTAIQSDGKIIIGGDFTTYNGTARNHIARINANGSLDVTFNPDSGANGAIRTTAIQSDGKIIIGGDFTNYNGTVRNYIARVCVSCINTYRSITVDACKVYTAPDNQIYTTSGIKTAVIANSMGCDSIITVNLIISTLQPLSSGTISGNTIVCQGQNSVTYTIPPISRATSYVWTLPGGATGASTTNTIAVNFGTSAVSGNITVKGINACGDGPVATLPVTVNPLPSAAGTITGATSVCPGQTTVIYSVPVITNATSYIWTLPNGATGTSTTNNITVNFGTSAVTGNITVKGTNACGAGFVATLPITVNPLPVAAGTISGTASVCSEQTAVTYTAPAITNASSYVWTLPAGAAGTSTTNSITVDFDASAVSGNITVKGTNSCGDGAVSILPVTVNAKPATPAITLNGGVLLSDVPSGNQWYDQNGAITGATDQDYCFTANGDYYVIVTLLNCSSNPSNIITISNAGIELAFDNGVVKIYPNPFSNEIIIDPGNNSENISFEILSSVGQVVYEGVVSNKTIVPSAEFAPGVYVIKLKNGEDEQFLKIVKE